MENKGERNSETMANIVRLTLVVINIILACAQSYPSRANSGRNRLIPALTRPCTHQDLNVKSGEGNAAMGGVREQPFIFTNVSASPCMLEGYPGLELLSQKGSLIKRASKQKSDQAIATVIIEPRKTAWFNLNYNAGGAGRTGKPCPAYPKVRITAPGVSPPFVLRADIQTCPRTDFSVTAITSGEPQ